MSTKLNCPLSVSVFLSQFLIELKTLLPYQDLIGVYATGSLSYGGFDPSKSDIDLCVLTSHPLRPKQIKQLEKLHHSLGQFDPEWSTRLECSYIPIGYFYNTTPPKSPRPYFNGHFYPAAPYGPEWAINYALIYDFALPLYGPDIQELIEPIPMTAVKAACLQDIREEWAPKITDSKLLNDPAYQAYIPLTLCRSLYTLACDKITTKNQAAEWAKQQLGSRWSNLITTAQNWKPSQPLKLQAEVAAFIQFCVNETNKQQILIDKR
ncbi:MAG: DUF4111 domain-containing protein [Gammaproteobacteria bacterium]|nr:DUF4111 domain-containing protein [Gammaproteobacteria bacterium]